MIEENLLNEYKKVENFEQLLSLYTGAPYAISVDCCTNALLLCFLYSSEKKIILPKNTYVGVAMSALHAGKEIIFKDIDWTGQYNIAPTNIYDAAKRFTADMYVPGAHMCLSFHYKKHLKIGRGGAILTDSKEAADWFKLVRNSGRHIDQTLTEQLFTVRGYNMLFHPDLALKGIDLLKSLPAYNDDLPYEFYGDLEKQMATILN